MVDLDTRLITEVSKFPCGERSPIVCDYRVWDSKPMRDLLDKLNSFGGCDRCGWLRLYPLGELVNRDE